MRDPAREEKRYGGFGEVERVHALKHAAMKKVARVVERHQHHHQPAEQVHRVEPAAGRFHGISTLLADSQRAVVASASLACSSGNRCETILANGNSSWVVRRKSMAVLRCRGSLDHEPNT